jgi:hypothetical protein
MNTFSKTVTINGATAYRLSGLLVTSGYTGSMIGVSLKLTAPADRSLFIGSSSDVTDSGATKGREVLPTLTDENTATGFMGNVVDPATYYLYVAASPAATADIGISFTGL